MQDISAYHVVIMQSQQMSDQAITQVTNV